MMESPMPRLPHRQRGFGLIEVLVALTILSIGMLGLAAMQLNSLQNARESLNTTLATIMVRDINERAWAQQDETCKALLSKWQKDVAQINGPPAPDGSGKNIGNGLYDLQIIWQGGEGSDGEKATSPHVNLVAFLPCEAASG